jgi:gluconokinase
MESPAAPPLPDRSSAPLLVVMGVSGCGKSTLAEAIAERGNWNYLDADDFHPPANVAKMRSGEPLTDADRAGWLEILHDKLSETFGEGRGLVLACSALRRRYRDALRGFDRLPVIFVLLHGDRAILEKRLQSRPGHFMPASLLESQLATLELPESDECSITVDLETDLEAALNVVFGALGK